MVTEDDLPIAARAEGGNTIPSPPRLQGKAEDDILAMQAWVGDLHRTLAREANVVGTQKDLIDAINAQRDALLALDARLASVEAAFNALALMPASVSGTYVGAELAAAYDKINEIIRILRNP